MADLIKSWVMVLLTLVFVVLYSAALVGWLKPPADEKMIMRLEPIIFVVIGYYFGRLPGQQNEKTLKEEVGRLTQKADAIQHAKEQAQQSREVIEEKLKNVKAALALIGPAPGDHGATVISDRQQQIAHSVSSALRILNS
jgi:hypothetical protein